MEYVHTVFYNVFFISDKQFSYVIKFWMQLHISKKPGAWVTNVFWETIAREYSMNLKVKQAWRNLLVMISTQ